MGTAPSAAPPLQTPAVSSPAQTGSPSWASVAGYKRSEDAPGRQLRPPAPTGSILNMEAISYGWGYILVFDAATFADVDQFMRFAATTGTGPPQDYGTYLAPHNPPASSGGARPCRRQELIGCPWSALSG